MVCVATQACSQRRAEISEAAYAASIGSDDVHFCGSCCQLAIDDSRQPTRPGEMATALGNFPCLITRQRVVLEREVTSSTSLSRMKRSNLLTLAPLYAELPATLFQTR